MSYTSERRLLIAAWNTGVTIKTEIDKNYGKKKEKTAEAFKKSLNKILAILFETGQADTINRALTIIVNDSEIQNGCDKFPKMPRGLRNYIDEENAKRLILGRGPNKNRAIIQNNQLQETESLQMKVPEQSSSVTITTHATIQEVEPEPEPKPEPEPQVSDIDYKLFNARGIDIRPYNTWSFEHDNTFGIDHPGKIAAGIVLNTLYFYTQPGDLVVDPMAGGGTVGDCCREVNRKYLMYDLNPIRPDVKSHDIRNGIPKEAHNAKLLFWDPPYYKKQLEKYGPESISAMDRIRYLNIFTQVAMDSYDAGIERIALVMSDYISLNGNGDPNDNIFIWDYVEIFKNQGWNPINHIFCQLKTTQLHGRTITKYRREKLFAALSRSLVIFNRQ